LPTTTTALDVTIQAQILDLLGLRASHKMAMLLITPISIVAQMAHRVALMYAGQIVEVADTNEFFGSRCIRTRSICSRRFPTPASATGGWRRFRHRSPLNRTFAGCRFADRCGNVMDRCRASLRN
jgi:peptide/nickel transport system ATP-binding protein